MKKKTAIEIKKKLEQAISDPQAVAAAAFAAQSAIEGIVRMVEVIDGLPPDEKFTLFWALEGVSTTAYAAQCYLVYSLSNRDNPNRITIKQAAETLGINYQRARIMVGVWRKVFRPLVEREGVIPELPPRMYEEIYRKVDKFSLDPVAAAKYAWEKKVENPTYGIRDLANDLEAGLPSPSEPLPSCLHCVHWKRAPEGSYTILYSPDGVELARADGTGNRYCDVFHITKRDIDDPIKHAQSCSHFRDALRVRGDDEKG